MPWWPKGRGDGLRNQRLGVRVPFRAYNLTNAGKKTFYDIYITKLVRKMGFTLWRCRLMLELGSLLISWRGLESSTATYYFLYTIFIYFIYFIFFIFCYIFLFINFFTRCIIIIEFKISWVIDSVSR